MAQFDDVIILKDGVSRTLQDIMNNTYKAEKQVSSLQKRLNSIAGGMKSFGRTTMLTVTTPIVAMGTAMVKLASDMEETMNKVNVSFGESTNAVVKWSKSSITSMGLARQSALDSAALYGDMATGMGMSQENASKMAMTLTQLGADLASFKNISNDVAQTALKSIFTGETESLKNLGIVMTEVNLKNFMLEQGMKKSYKSLTEVEKINLRLAFVMARTTNAQGDFARTNQGAANQMRMFSQNLKELGANLGVFVLPAVTKLIIRINGLFDGFNKMSDGTKKAILVVGGFLAVIPPLLIGIGSLTTALTILSANPIVLIIAGITLAVVGLGIVIYKFRKQIYEAFEPLINFFKKIWDMVNKLISKFSGLKNVLSFANPVTGLFNIGKNIAESFSGDKTQAQETIAGSVQQTPINRTNNNSFTNTFNVSGTVREEADVDKIATSITNQLQMSVMNTGNYGV